MDFTYLLMSSGKFGQLYSHLGWCPLQVTTVDEPALRTAIPSTVLNTSGRHSLLLLWPKALEFPSQGLNAQADYRAGLIKIWLSSSGENRI